MRLYWDPRVHSSFFPEVAAGGYTRRDGTVEFYGRINALIQPQYNVLDFGCGRGAWLDKGEGAYTKKLRNLKGKAQKVIGADIDPVVKENTSLDEAIVLQPCSPLPFSDKSFDLILCDYVFEHIVDPKFISAELDRVLKPGGYLCARTPYKHTFFALFSRLVPNRYQARIARKSQKNRLKKDVFPTVYKMNTYAAIKNLFPQIEYKHMTYLYRAEPSYHFNNRWFYMGQLALNAVSPIGVATNLFIFLKKNESR